MARADHGARAARRAELPCALSRRSRTSRETPALFRSRTTRSTSSSRTQSSSTSATASAQRRFVAEALRVGRQRVPHDPEPPVPDRAAHEAAARALAARASGASRRTTRSGKGCAKEIAPAVAARLRVALPRSGAHRQPRSDPGGDRRLARATLTRVRARACSSSASRFTTRPWRSSGSSASAGRRSTSSPPGRRRSSWSRSLVVAWKVRRLPPYSWPTSSPRLRGRRRPVLLLPPGRARRRRDRAGRASRASPSSLPGRRLRARPARASPAGGGRVGWARRLVAVAVAALVGLLDLALVSLQAWRDSGVPGWYRGAARARLRGSIRPAGELGLQHGRRAQPDPAARLDVPLAARERVRPRRRAHLRGRPAAPLVVGPPRAAPLRGPALYAHACCVRGARGGARRARGRAAARSRPRCSPSCRSSSRSRSSSAYPRIGPSTSYTAERARVPPRRTPTPKAGASARPVSGGDDASTESHWRNLRDGVEAVIEHPQGYGLGNAGVVAKRTGVEIKRGRVDLRRARRRCGRRRARGFRPLERRNPPRAVATGGVARGGVRRRPRFSACRRT